MSQKVSDLCGDSLFQLNLAIWMAQPKPKHFTVRPILYESGFEIYSIGPLLALPPDVRLIISESSLSYQVGAKPELVLVSANRKKICMLECKRSSFGIDSSTADQARTLMILSGPIVAEVMAIGPRGSVRGILAYLTRANQATDLQSTLASLKRAIKSLKLDSGECGCLGITSSDKAILMEYSDSVKTLMDFSDVSPIEIMSVEDDTDPRPLYFIPYDPSVFNEQSEDEQRLCRRILFERFLGHIFSRIGSSSIPSEVVFAKDELLEAATLGVYKIWDDKEAKRYMRSLLRNFMDSLISYLSPELRKLIEHDTQKGWVLKLDEYENLEEMMKQVSRFRPEGMDLTQQISLELF
jgi:hypothetical protein